MIKKTKIVCTIGPACDQDDTIRKMIAAGMDIARLNFSHGSHDSHRSTFQRIRRIATEMASPVGILQDLCGPKIRLGEIPGDGHVLQDGDLVKLTGEDLTPEAGLFHVSYPRLSLDLKPGEPILIDDGLIHLRVESIQGPVVHCRTLVGGTLKSNKGANFPESDLGISAISEKDLEDVRLGMELGVDFVALSFVRKAEDLLQLKRFMENEKKFIPIVAKIEKREAVANREAILTMADGAMVARGDLGIEAPIEEVPLIQKEIIKLCNRMSKPVITATQMLDSMIRNPIPTRAEVTDIANAILDGTDAVMLSGETASGKYPVEAVKMMDKICVATEQLMKKRARPEYNFHHNVVDSISESTCKIAEELNAHGIVVLTDSGRTARLVSRYKPDAPILAITYNQESQHRLKLSWGVFPLLVEATSDTDKMLENASKAALSSGIVKTGELVVITAGIPAMIKGSTNMIKVDVLGHVFRRGNGVGPILKATGKVCIVETAEQALASVDKDDILVTKRLDDSFLSIANRPAGIITEEGGEGSYGEFFCAKFQIPGILGVPEATTTFYPGQILTLETELGIIYGPRTNM